MMVAKVLARERTARVETQPDSAPGAVPEHGPWLRFNWAHAFAVVSLALLVGVLAWIEHASSGTLDAARLPHRLAQLLDPAFWALGGPIVLFTIRYGWDPRERRRALARGIKIGATLFGIAALWLGAVVISAFLDGKKPWEGLPGVTPPFLDKFLQRHPGFDLSTYDGTSMIIVYGPSGGRWIIDGELLRGDARVAFEPCESPLDPAALGGIVPYPKSRCEVRIHLTGSTLERVTYLFRVAEESTVEDIENHFKGWAKGMGAELGSKPGLWGGGTHFFMQKAERLWEFELHTSRTDGKTLYIPAAGARGR